MDNTKKINIIIADSDREYCDVIKEYILSQSDIIVSGIANDGIELLKLIQEKVPNLVILNIILPPFDGLEILKMINKMNLDPMPQIIILSEIRENEIIQKSVILGIDNYIIKPFELDVLLKIIRQMKKD